MAVSSDETAAALADIRELLTKIEKERVAAWVEQVRRAGRDIDRAGHNLDSVQPLAMGLTSGALLAGVFCTLNGVAILMFARHLLPPGERRREAGAAMTLAAA
jgi:cell division protein FtsX